MRSDANQLIALGKQISELVFDNGATWCQRRVLMLDFLDERRGEWSVNIDFRVPRVDKIALLTKPSEVDGHCPNYLVPLLTFPKDFLPPAHIKTLDEQGSYLSLADSETSRLTSFVILLATATQADIALVSTNWDHLWQLTSPDTVDAYKAWLTLENVLRPQAPTELTARFFKIAQLLTRSVLLLLEFPNDSLGKRKIVTFTHDGPIRMTRNKAEVFGFRPLSICPRCAFGGNAQSYHVQMHSPERLTVVDSRILYSYYASAAGGHDDEGSSGDGARRPPDRKLPTPDKLVGRRGPIDWMASHGISQWWGQVEGPAEPMSAHVRCSEERMPAMEDGREVFAVFQLYPQFAGQLTLFFIAAAANVGFAWALFAGIVWGRNFRTHTGGFLGFNALAYEHPEAILIMTVLVTGFGVGLILYPKEHLITSGVLRPWRWVEGLIIVLTLAIAMTSLWGWKPVGHHLWPNFEVLFVEIMLDSVAFLYLAIIIARPWFAEPEGGHGWKHTGLRIRRIAYPRRWWPFWRYPPWKGRVVDDHELAEMELDGKKSQRWVRRSAQLQDTKMDRIENQYAKHLLVSSESRELFNRGIPPAIRHDRLERGY
jgi:hypothetical protein